MPELSENRGFFARLKQRLGSGAAKVSGGLRSLFRVLDDVAALQAAMAAEMAAA